MEFTKEYLQSKRDGFLQAAERCKLDSIANAAGADAIDELIRELEAEVESPSPAPEIERE